MKRRHHVKPRAFLSTKFSPEFQLGWRFESTLITNRRAPKSKKKKIFLNIFNMHHVIILLSAIGLSSASMQYIPPLKQEHLFTDILLRELVDRMGNDFVDMPDNYIDFPYGSRIQNDYEKVKEIPAEIPPLDYEGIDTPNPNPSIRDQEYLQHSSLSSHQRLNNNNNNNNEENNRYRIQAAGVKGIIKYEKSETNLPAYCTPPNPCPIGYSEENNCLTNFENTAAFSRDYQSAQDCMCDKEHMAGCPSGSESNNNALANVHISNSDFDQIVEQFQHENPFFEGEKLPIAAKKGINVGY